MTEPAEVYRLQANPWLSCTVCAHPVHSRSDTGRNVPCGHVADVESVCESWDSCGRCVCLDEIEKAEALQEALEMSDAEAVAQRRATAMIDQAETWRPTLWAWVAFAVTASLIIGALATLGTGR